MVPKRSIKLYCLLLTHYLSIFLYPFFISFSSFYSFFYPKGIQGQDDVIITRGDTLHWVRALGFSTHFSWNFAVYDSDQIEVAMARTRENERITKIRNDQHRDSLLAAALKLQEKEKESYSYSESS